MCSCAVLCRAVQFLIGSVLSIMLWVTGAVQVPKLDAQTVSQAGQQIMRRQVGTAQRAAVGSGLQSWRGALQEAKHGLCCLQCESRLC